MQELFSESLPFPPSGVGSQAAAAAAAKAAKYGEYLRSSLASPLPQQPSHYTWGLPHRHLPLPVLIYPNVSTPLASSIPPSCLPSVHSVFLLSLSILPSLPPSIHLFQSTGTDKSPTRKCRPCCGITEERDIISTWGKS